MSCDTCFVALSTTHTVIKFVDDVGPVGDSAMGVCQEAVGVVTCSYQSQKESDYTVWDAAGKIIGTIDECLKIHARWQFGGKTFLVALDLFLPIGICLTTIGSAKHG